MRHRLCALAACAVALAAAAVLGGTRQAAAQEASARGAQEKAPQVEHLSSAGIFPGDLPFAEAVRVGDMLYLSGMVGVQPGTLELVDGGVRAEGRRAMENIRLLLERYGSSMDRLARCTVFLADISEWPAFNEVYESFFHDRYPARSALGADGLALGARVEIECTAAVGKGQ